MIGSVVGESLQDYLSPRRSIPPTLERRLGRFQDAFGQALATSKPLVNIDAQALSRVHEVHAPNVSYLFTEIPFPEGTPGFEAVKTILESQGRWDDKVQAAFGEGRQSRIDVFSMFAGTRTTRWSSNRSWARSPTNGLTSSSVPIDAMRFGAGDTLGHSHPSCRFPARSGWRWFVAGSRHDFLDCCDSRNLTAAR